MCFKNFLAKALSVVSCVAVSGSLLSSVLKTSSWAMLPRPCDEIVEPIKRIINGGWNQKQIENSHFISGNPKFQNNKMKIEDLRIETVPDEGQKLLPKTVIPAINKGWSQKQIENAHFIPGHTNFQKNEAKSAFVIQKNEVRKMEPYQNQWKDAFEIYSSEEERDNFSIRSSRSSEEDFIESSEEDHSNKLQQKKRFKRLKKKKQIRYEDSSDEQTSSGTDSDCLSDNSLSSSSTDEDYEESFKSRASSKKKNKKTLSKKQQPCPIVATRSSRKTLRSGNSNPLSFIKAAESEEEDDVPNRIIPAAGNNEDFNLVTTMGTRLKLLANAYLANLEGRANIFLPRYTLEVEHPEGLFQIKSFFETPKGEICVFASGGLHHIWEKNIGHINQIFFGEKVKIIRSHWMQKHLQKDRGIERNLEEEFIGREHELHSEFYYDLFFRHFFVHELSQLAEEGVRLRRLTIHAFSWWDVCNGCEKLLSNHKPPEETNFELLYKIAARKRYSHAYPSTSIVEDYRLPVTVEEEAWKTIWESLSHYTDQSVSCEEKEIFWTRTKDGLEICKWLGQVFRETTKGLDGRARVAKKGDVLAFYGSMKPEKKEALENLLFYLQDKNWDLSCWYRGPNFPNGTQPKWKRHWKQQIVPHFGWERVTQYKIKDKKRSDHCEMCGNSDLMNVYLVFHPKFHVSNTFLSLPEEEQKLTESECGYTIESRVSDFPLALKQKRKQSIHVGSECIKSLRLTREQIDEWHELHPKTDVNDKWEVERLEFYDALDAAEKNLKSSEKKKRKK